MVAPTVEHERPKIKSPSDQFTIPYIFFRKEEILILNSKEEVFHL